MRRYVPKTYNNRRLLRIIFRSVVIALCTVLIVFIVLFFGFYSYFLTGEDGTGSMEIPWLTDVQEPPG